MKPCELRPWHPKGPHNLWWLVRQRHPIRSLCKACWSVTTSPVQLRAQIRSLSCELPRCVSASPNLSDRGVASFVRPCCSNQTAAARRQPLRLEVAMTLADLRLSSAAVQDDIALQRQRRQSYRSLRAATCQFTLGTSGMLACHERHRSAQSRGVGRAGERQVEILSSILLCQCICYAS